MTLGESIFLTVQNSNHPLWAPNAHHPFGSCHRSTQRFTDVMSPWCRQLGVSGQGLYVITFHKYLLRTHKYNQIHGDGWRTVVSMVSMVFQWTIHFFGRWLWHVSRWLKAGERIHFRISFCNGCQCCWHLPGSHWSHPSNPLYENVSNLYLDVHPR